MSKAAEPNTSRSCHVHRPFHVCQPRCGRRQAQARRGAGARVMRLLWTLPACGGAKAFAAPLPAPHKHARQPAAMPALLAALCLAALGLASACNSVVLRDVYPDGCLGDKSYRGGVVSASSFSQTWDLAAGTLIMPRGVKTPMLSVDAAGTPSMFGRDLTIKYNAVCLGHDVLALAKVQGTYNRETWNVPHGYYLCNQGMNDKGLAVSYQANEAEPVPPYDASQGNNAINYWDIAKTVLTQFATVAEVEAAYNYQVVSSPQYSFFGELSRTHSEQWLAIYDATGAAAVIEFHGGLGPRFVRNPLGVLANEPGFLEDHLRNYTNWVTSRGMTIDPASYLITGPLFTAPDGPGTAGFITKAEFKKADSLPGGFDGDARFIRMAMLKSAAVLKGCWPDPSISQSSQQARLRGYPELLPSLLTVKAIIDTVSLPKGLTDMGEMGIYYVGTGRDWRQDKTFWYTLRDHGNLLFLYKTANNFAYRLFDLKRARWNRYAYKGKPTFIDLVGLENPGIVDVTSELY